MAMAASIPRTYESALADLAALQSNKAITSLFPAPTPAASSESTSPDDKIDLNALAIPEMLAWADRAGISRDDIAKQLRCIHVAGTKGKGSVCAHLTALLTRGGSLREGTSGAGAGAGAGVAEANVATKETDAHIRSLAGKVGTYTSPHLVSVRERIAIDGEPISQELFAKYFYEVWDACTEAARAAAAAATAVATGETTTISSAAITEEQLQGPGTKPFFFRFLTLVALRAFLGEGVRTAIIECGIGGEYDSTNILPAASVTASIVTQLGIDHVGMLGGTLPEIAWHKAGVFRPLPTLNFTRRLTADNLGGGENAAAVAEDTMCVLRQRAEEKNALLVEVRDRDVEAWGGVSAPGSLEGEFQKYNQALAVLAMRRHMDVLAAEQTGFPPPRPSVPGPDQDGQVMIIQPEIASALQFSRLRGRCETFEEGDVTWLIDGAHTAESLAEVARWFASKIDGGLSSSAETRILLFNQQDRDAAKLVRGLLEDIATSAIADSKTDSGVQQQRIPPAFAHAILTRNDLLPAGKDEEGKRDLSAQRAAAQAVQTALSNGSTTTTSTSVVDNVADAVAEIRTRAALTREKEGKKTVVLVTGSLHLVGALLRTLEPESTL